MCVFLSWSGPRSHVIAVGLGRLIESVTGAKTFISNEMPVGPPWFSELRSALSDAEVGIVCLTRRNLCSPWLFFEAGAIFGKVDESKLIPYIFDDLDSKQFTDTPIHLLQAARANRDDTKRVLEMIYLGQHQRKPDTGFHEQFDKEYKVFELQIEQAKKKPDKQPACVWPCRGWKALAVMLVGIILAACAGLAVSAARAQEPVIDARITHINDVAVEGGLGTKAKPIDVPQTNSARGIAKGLPEKSHLWIVVHPEGSHNWPQFGEAPVHPRTGEWSQTFNIGGTGQDYGKKFDVLLVNCTDAAHAELQKWQTEGE